MGFLQEVAKGNVQEDKWMYTPIRKEEKLDHWADLKYLGRSMPMDDSKIHDSAVYKNLKKLLPNSRSGVQQPLIRELAMRRKKPVGTVPE